MFCKNCGKDISDNAINCPKCGEPLQRKTVLASKEKTKLTSVLLAVFLGFWTWLYTYDEDKVKFWVNFGLCICSFGIWGFVAWPWAIIDVSIKSTEWYEEYPNC
jgi:hypothetical protein